MQIDRFVSARRKAIDFLEKNPRAYRTGNLILLLVPCLLVPAIYPGFRTFPYLIFCVVTLALITVLTRLLKLRRKEWVRKLDSLGFCLISLTVLLAGWAWLLRMQSEWRVVIGVACLIGYLLVVLPRLHRPIASMRVLRFKFGFLGGPFLLAWIISSSLHLLHTQMSAWRDEIQAPGSDDSRRTDLVRERPGIKAALALSGGGYRAAAIHAGVLRELEAQGLPLHYLSTVSGGSIAGAYYALGHSAEDFQSLLLSRKLWWTNKPGLANDLFNIANLGSELFGPSWRNSDTLADHLARVFYGEARLKDTAGKTPRLILNATNQATQSRAIFTARAPGEPASVDNAWGDARLADVVAASGAFPAVFEPKVIGCQEFIDGGVIENLGVLGIREFFLDRKETEGRPNVVVISDVSEVAEQPGAAIPSTPPCPLRKHFVTDALKSAVSTMGATGSRELYRIFTGEKFDGGPLAQAPQEQPFHAHLHDVYHFDETGCFHTFVFAPTSRAEQTYLRSLPASVKSYAIGGSTEAITDKDIKKLAELTTFVELGRREVFAAGWAGQMVARRHLQNAKSRTGDLWAFLAERDALGLSREHH